MPHFDHMLGGYAPANQLKFMYYPRVTIISPYLTEIIPLHDHLWQPQKQAQTHLHVTVQQPEQPKGRTTAAVASSRGGYLREIIHEESNNIQNKILIIPKHTKICKLENQIGRNTTTVGGG